MARTLAGRDAYVHHLQQQNTSQLLRMPYQAYIGLLFSRLAAAGYGDVHPAHAIVFQHLPEEGARVTELADRTQLTKQYLGRLVAEMEALGYLERVPDATDARAKLVRLSDSGRAITRAAEGIITDIEAIWMRGIGEKRYAELRRSLIDVITMLDADTLAQPITPPESDSFGVSARNGR